MSVADFPKNTPEFLLDPREVDLHTRKLGCIFSGAPDWEGCDKRDKG